MKKNVLFGVIILCFLVFLSIAVAKDSSRLRSQPNFISVNRYSAPSLRYSTVTEKNIFYAGYGHVCGLIQESPAVIVECSGEYNCEKFNSRVGFCGVRKDFRHFYSRWY